MQYQKKAIVSATVLLSAGLALASCSTTPADPPAAVASAPAESSNARATHPSSDYLGDWGIISVDADPVSTVNELTSFSEIGVIGKVGSFTEAQLTSEDPLGADVINQVVLRLDEPEIIFGALPDGNDGHAYIALPGISTAEEYAESIPVGTKVIAYGNDLTTLPEDIRLEVIEGVPAGQGVFNVSHPSGLGIEIVNQSGRSAGPVLVFPMQGSAVSGMGVDDLLPGEGIPDFEESIGD